ncbi:MAG: MFS transporter [Actinomycetota bacterium]|nr:MFS transporter [Actinomycetota bacterium]
MITIIALIFGAVCLYMSLIIHPIMLFIGFFLIRLFGQSSMIIGPSTLIPRWFEKKRGRALSFISIGGITAAALLPPFNTWMINNWGWRMGWLFWAISIWLIMVPLAWFLIRNHPEDIGLVSDGTVTGSSSNGRSDDEKYNQGKKIMPSMTTFAEARRNLSFWLLNFCAFVISNDKPQELPFILFQFLRSKDFLTEIAASTLSIIAFVSFPVTIIAGFILDRVKIRYVLTSTNIFFSFALIWLLNVNTLPKAIIYGILLGIVAGFYLVILNFIWPKYFGLQHLGSIRGAVQISSGYRICIWSFAFWYCL